MMISHLSPDQQQPGLLLSRRSILKKISLSGLRSEVKKPSQEATKGKRWEIKCRCEVKLTRDFSWTGCSLRVQLDNQDLWDLGRRDAGDAFLAIERECGLKYELCRELTTGLWRYLRSGLAVHYFPAIKWQLGCALFCWGCNSWIRVLGERLLCFFFGFLNQNWQEFWAHINSHAKKNHTPTHTLSKSHTKPHTNSHNHTRTQKTTHTLKTL